MNNILIKRLICCSALGVAILVGMTYSAVPAHADPTCGINNYCAPIQGQGICDGTLTDLGFGEYACNCLVFFPGAEIPDNRDCSAGE